MNRLVLALVFMRFSVESARMRLPFGSTNPKPLQGVPYWGGLDKQAAREEEYMSEKTAMRRLNPKGSRLLQSKCGEHPPILWSKDDGHVEFEIIEGGLHWAFVLLSNDGQYLCGATLISQRHLLTAASCFRMVRAEGQAGDPVGIGVYSALSCEIGVRDVIPRLCDYGKKGILPRWMRLEVEAVFYTHHNASDEYYSTIDSYVEDVAIIQLVNDIRAQQDMRSRQYLRPACLPTSSSDFDWKLAGKLNDGRPQATYPFTWGLRLSKQQTGLRAGTYAKIELKSVTTQIDGNDEWQTKLCATPGLLCIVLPFKNFAFDYWMLPGTGVFATTNENANTPTLFPKHYLYGHVVEVLPCRNNKKHFHIVIRETQSILNDLCFYSGACPDEVMLVNRTDESRLSLFLDTAYLPKFHNGSRLWTLPDWKQAPENVGSLGKLLDDVGQKPAESVVKDTTLLNGPDSEYENTRRERHLLRGKEDLQSDA